MSAPRRIFLFSGHMIDAKNRSHPRFPPDKEGAAAQAIESVLDERTAGRGDLGITEGACGGDLLFAEAMLARGAGLELRLPFDQATFLRKSVDFEKASAAPDRWHERFLAVRAQSTLMEMPEVLGPTPESEDPYERCNLWMLNDAFALGAENVCFICLWDGGGGDGPGGTRHMVESVRARGGDVRWLDVRTLW